MAVVSGYTKPPSGCQATGTIPRPVPELVVTRTTRDSARIAPMLSTWSFPDTMVKTAGTWGLDVLSAVHAASCATSARHMSTKRDFRAT